MRFKNKKITVMGLGLFSGGVEVTRYLVDQGAVVTVTDLRDEKVLAPSVTLLKDVAVTWHLGNHQMSDFTEADYIIKSPAVPDTSPYLQAAVAAGVPVETEINMVFALAQSPIIGITGSNGKTTTTALMGHIFNCSAQKAVVGGNIGRSVINALAYIQSEILILELSSFQLDDLDKTGKSPHIAVITNLTPNHLDRHGSMKQYVAAKKNIVCNQTPQDIAVLNYDDPRLRAWGGMCSGEVYCFSRTRSIPQGCFLKNETIIFRNSAGVEKHIAHISLLQLPGKHNIENALAAVTVACINNVPVQDIQKGLETFHGVPHRLELVRTLNGTRYFNDSIATTPESTIAALESFDGNVVLIAGGYDKEIPFNALAGVVAQRTKGVVLIGATAVKIAHAVKNIESSHVPVVVQAASLEEAIADAEELAKKDSVVLLSPACASYDMFINFTERGDRFRRAVESI